MHTNRKLLVIALGLACAGTASAVHLDPGGRGQALIYPYYTVNKQQQTLISVVNTGSVAQVADVSFREGYNGRLVMNFQVFLEPYDVWTGTVFASDDAGLRDDSAAIMTSDTSCTSPQFSAGDGVLNGLPYVKFRNLTYAGGTGISDGGPETLTRTREGYLEIVALADLAPPLSTYIKHGSNGSAPTGCAQVQGLTLSDITTRPTGGLIGTASIVNVAAGTLLSSRAEALGNFTAKPLLTNTAVLFGGLATVNDSGASGTATARIFDAAGKMHDLTFGAGSNSRPVDAVSAVLMAEQIYNEYQVSASLSAGSDWVLSFPTKRFYTDPQLTDRAWAPFETLFASPGQSCVDINVDQYSREAVTPPNQPAPIPPAYPAFSHLCHATTVLAFGQTAAPSSVLGSRLVTTGTPLSDAGWLSLKLDTAEHGHRLSPALPGKVLRGLPVIGFWASNVVNNNVSNGVLANYSAAVRHVTAQACVLAFDGVTPCD